jgi:acetyl-CoA acyltransferase
MNELGHTDPLGITAENLAEARYGVSPEASGAERTVGEYEISRERQDRFALRSHRLAVGAQEAGRFGDEIVPVTVGTRGDALVVNADEGPRSDTSLERLAKLPPVFKAQGNSSPLNDGAAAVLIVSERYARAHGLEPMVRVRAVAVAGMPPRVTGLGPVPATRKALARAGAGLEDLGLVELNEAFAAQSLAVIGELGIDPDDDRLNPNGGAIALGHPLGCSGARILTTLVHEMGRRRDAELGLATMCIGVGQGIAMVLERAG